MESTSRNLRQSILEYILYETSTNAYTDDNLESLEVAKQCLETAWNMEVNKKSNDLLKLFESLQKTHVEKREVTEEDKKAAELLKSQGNICMGENLFDDAVSCYTKAIELDGQNAVYFCNRAAAYSKLNKNESAIADCNHALTIDSNYSKAYSRMGLAYTAMNKFDDAIRCYKRALEIEPDNQNYKQNLQAAEEKRSCGHVDDGGEPAVNAGPGGLPAGFGSLLNNVDLGSLLNNPAMMNMAQQFMSQPDMRNMMTQMMQSVIPPSTATAGNQNVNSSSAEPAAAPTTNINDFLSFGQQFAQQMQSANPDLVNSLRQQFQQGGPHEDGGHDDGNQNAGPQI